MQSALVKRAIQAYGQAVLTIDPVRVRLWEDQGLTVLQLRLVHLLFANERMPVGRLASELRTTPASVTGLTDRLVARELVQREHDPNDHRVVRLSLTAKGRTMVQDLQTLGAEYLTAVFEQMDKGQLERFVNCLEAFCTAARSVQGQQTNGGATE
jgi:DNA-binding MarR family transcriptional regulator